MSEQELSNRVDRLETTVGGVVTQMENLTNQFSRLVDGLSQLQPAAQREAHTVKTEMREEQERSSRQKSELFKNGLALVGGIVLVVGAIGGPYLNKVNTTADQTEDLNKRVGEIREVIAQQGAAIGRAQASIDLSRDKNIRQDNDINDSAEKLQYLNGYLAGKGVIGGAPPK